MLMCREATKLMSLKQDKTLSLREQLSLRVHLAMCQACRNCSHQFDLLHQANHHHPHSPLKDTQTLDE